MAFSKDGLIGLLGPYYWRQDGDRLVYGFQSDARHGNPNGVIHGGALTAFADTLTGHLIEHACGRKCATIALDSRFMAAGKVVGFGAPQALSGAGACNVTTIATLFTSTGAAQALTLADGTRAGQLKFVSHVVDGGSGVLTPTTKTGFTTVTFTNVNDWVCLIWSGSAWFVLATKLRRDELRQWLSAVLMRDCIVAPTEASKR